MVWLNVRVDVGAGDDDRDGVDDPFVEDWDGLRERLIDFVGPDIDPLRVIDFGCEMDGDAESLRERWADTVPFVTDRLLVADTVREDDTW